MSKAAATHITTLPRRQILAGLAAFSIGGVAAAASHDRPVADPVLDLVADRLAAATMESMAKTDADSDRLHERVIDCEERLIRTRPTSLAGAVAGLELARDEYRLMCGDSGAREDRLMLALIEGAIGIMQARV